MEDSKLYGPSRVFIPHVHERFDPVAQRLVPAFDFSGAAKYGQLVKVLDSSDDPTFLQSLTARIKFRLQDFDSSNDWLIAVGDPGVIAVCSGIILRNERLLRMLKWDRTIRQYIPLELTL